MFGSVNKALAASSHEKKKSFFNPRGDPFMREKRRNVLFFKPPTSSVHQQQEIFGKKSIKRGSFSSFILFFLSLLSFKVLLGKYVLP
jgi:hypothetical protein